MSGTQELPRVEITEFLDVNMNHCISAGSERTHIVAVFVKGPRYYYEDMYYSRGYNYGEARARLRSTVFKSGHPVITFH